LRECTEESPDRRESRVRFGPVEVKQVKVDVGARGLELSWINVEQETACVSIAQGKEQDAVKSGADCDDEQAASQEGLHPMAHHDDWERANQPFVGERVVQVGTDQILSARESRELLSSCCVGQRLVMMAPHGVRRRDEANQRQTSL